MGALGNMGNTGAMGAVPKARDGKNAEAASRFARRRRSRAFLLLACAALAACVVPGAAVAVPATCGGSGSTEDAHPNMIAAAINTAMMTAQSMADDEASTVDQAITGTRFSAPVQHTSATGVQDTVACSFTVTGEGTCSVVGDGTKGGAKAVDIATDGTIAIPEKVEHNAEQYTVTAVGDYAFGDIRLDVVCGQLERVDIPDTVTSVGVYAFSRCEKLAVPAIASGLKTIGDHAYYNCISIKGLLQIPASVETIDKYAFCMCTGLEAVEFLGDAPKVEPYAFTGANVKIGKVIFNGACIKYADKSDAETLRFNSQLVGDPAFFYTVYFYKNKDSVVLGPSQSIGKALVSGNVTYRTLDDRLNGTSSVLTGSVPDYPDQTNLWTCSSMGSSGYNATIDDSCSAWATWSNYRDLSKATAKVTADDAWLSYTGMAIDPKVEVTDALGGVLEAGDDYTLSYDRKDASGNWSATDDVTSVGEVRVRVVPTEAGRYTSTTQTTFSISFDKGATFVSNIDVEAQDGTITQTPCWFKVTSMPSEEGGKGTLSVARGNPLFTQGRGDNVSYVYPKALDASVNGTVTIPAELTANGMGFDVASIEESAFGEWYRMQDGQLVSDKIPCSIEGVRIAPSITEVGKNAFRGCTKLGELEFEGDADNIAFGETVFKGTSNIRTVVWRGKKSANQFLFGSDQDPYCTPTNYYTLTFYASKEAVDKEEPLGKVALSQNVKLAFIQKAVDLASGKYDGQVPALPDTFEDDGKWLAPCWNYTDVNVDNAKALASTLDDSHSVYAEQTNDAYTVSDAIFDGLSTGQLFAYMGGPAIDPATDFSVATGVGKLLEYGKDYTVSYARKSAYDDEKWEETDDIVHGGDIRVIVRGAGSYSGMTHVDVKIDAPAYKVGDIFEADVTLVSDEAGGGTVEGKASCSFKVVSDGDNPTVAASRSGDAPAVAADTAGRIEMPATVTYLGTIFTVSAIGDSAFRECTGLTGIDLPQTIEAIGESAFAKCSSLLTIEVPNSVTNLGGYAFANCSSLASAKVGGSSSIRSYAFNACRALSAVTVGASVPSIEDYAFMSTSGLQQLELGSGSTVVKGNAFSNSGLRTLAYAEGVENIAASACADLKTITSLDLPSTLASIGDKAFSGSALVDIAISESVRSIGSAAFGRCSKLTTVRFAGDPNAIEMEQAFTQSRKISSVVYGGPVLKQMSTVFSPSSPLEYSVVTFYSDAQAVGTEAPIGELIVRVGMGLSQINSGSVASANIFSGSVPSLPDGCNIWCFEGNPPLSDQLGGATYAYGRTVDLQDLSFGRVLVDPAFPYTGSAVDPIPGGGAKVVDARGTYLELGTHYTARYQRRGDDDEWADTNDLVSTGRLRIVATAVEGGGYAGQICGEFVIASLMPGQTFEALDANGVWITYKVLEVADEKTCGKVAVGVGGEDGQAVAESAKGAVTVPSQVSDSKGYPYDVTEISDHAFYRRVYITSLEIPSTIASIGSKAFAYEFEKGDVEISTLRNVTLGCDLSASAIAADAFDGCNAIKNVVYGLSSGGFDSFGGSTGVTRWYTARYFREGASKPTARVIAKEGSYLYSLSPSDMWAGSDAVPDAADGCEWVYDASALASNGSVCDSQDVRERKVEDGTFAAQVELVQADGTSTNVECRFKQGLDDDGQPDGTASVGTSIEGETAVATAVAGKLVVPASVTAEDGVTYKVTGVSDYAFGGGDGSAACTGLTAVWLPASVKLVGAAAFMGCSGLKSVDFAGGDSQLVRIGASAFEDATSLTAITLPESLQEVSARAFAGSGVVRARIPQSVRSLGRSAFAGCANLREVVFGGAMSLNLPAPEGADESWKEAASVADPCTQSATNASSLSLIDDWTFSDCPALTRVVFDANMAGTAVSDEAFENDGNISTVVYGDKRVRETVQFGTSQPAVWATASYFANEENVEQHVRESYMCLAVGAVYSQRTDASVLAGAEPAIEDYYEWKYDFDPEAAFADSGYAFRHKIEYAIDVSGVDAAFDMACFVGGTAVGTATYGDEVLLKATSEHAVQPAAITVRNAATGEAIVDASPNVDGVTFVMPGSAVTVEVTASITLQVESQSARGTVEHKATLSLDDVLAIADDQGGGDDGGDIGDDGDGETDPAGRTLLYSAYDNVGQTRFFSTSSYVDLAHLLSKCGAKFEAGDSLIFKSGDREVGTISYEDLAGDRCYYPYAAAGELADAVKVEPVLAATCTEAASADALGTESLCSAFRLLFGQSEQDLSRHVGTYGSMTAEITSITVLEGAQDVSGFKISGIDDTYSWTGDAIEPEPVVSAADGTVLRDGIDYELSYSNSTGPGLAVGTATGIGFYRGTLDFQYAILKVTPIAGDTATATAAETAYEAFPNGASGAIVATRDGFADALAGAALAGVMDVPLLLTGSSELSTDTANAIEVLSNGQPEFNLVIAGGENAVSAKVEASLSKMVTGTVSRLAGKDRYETSYLIYEYGKTVSKWSDTVVVASGSNFRDALSISPFAVAEKCPLLLTDGSTVTDDYSKMLQNDGFVFAVVVGGTAAVSQDVSAAVEAKVGLGNAERIAGENAYETSKQIALWEMNQGMSADGAGITTGRKFPDALAGSVLLGKDRSILMLVDEDNMTALDALEATEDPVHELRIFGGTAAVPMPVRRAALDKLGWDYDLL